MNIFQEVSAVSTQPITWPLTLAMSFFQYSIPHPPPYHYPFVAPLPVPLPTIAILFPLPGEKLLFPQSLPLIPKL